MRPGREVYGDLNRAVEEARQRVHQAGEDLRRVTEVMEGLRRDEARRVTELAMVRLKALEQENLREGLDSADRLALDLLRQRDAQLAKMSQSVEASERLQSELNGRREVLREARDAALSTRDAKAQEALRALEDQAIHRERFQRAEQVAHNAQQAQEKARQAEADRVEKGKPYKSNKLFSYLWRRRYLFPEYRASNVIRTLDGWVARLCRYREEHRDYMMLLEIPKRLAAHAEKLQAAANEEAAALGKLRARALEAAGVPAFVDALAKAEASLQEQDAAIDREEEAYGHLLKERSALEGGDDRFTQQAREVLERQIQGEDVTTLASDASLTRTHEDDALAQAVGDLRSRRSREEARRVEAQSQQDRALSELTKVEELRREFRHKSFDSQDSQFDGGINMGQILGELLEGTIAVGQAWGRVNRHHRFGRPRIEETISDMFGRGGVFGGSRGSSGGGSSTRRSGPSAPSSGGFGGDGGFETGGGF